MSYSVKPGDVFGRLGSGIGQGLSEQIPKEVENYRLRQGLQKLQEQAPKLNPMQFATQAYGTYGITPQMVQSLGELAQRQAQANSLTQNKTSTTQEFPISKKNIDTSRNQPEGITTPEGIRATTRPYRPRSIDEINQAAAIRYNENPGLYKNDPQLAIAAEQQQEAINEKTNAVLQAQRQGENAVQDRLQSQLQQNIQNQKVKAPGNVYTDIEKEALNSIKPISEGGEGLTEYEAANKYGKKLDTISRDYSALDAVGNFSMLGRKPSVNKSSIFNLRNKFKERNDLENFADTLIGENGLSPGKAYLLSYPVSEVKSLNNAIQKLPKLGNALSMNEKGKFLGEQEISKRSLETAEKLAPLLGKEASPLSVAEELSSRGYDPDIFLDYLRNHRKELDLTERQGRELDKPRNFIPTLNDLWLFYLSGLDDLVEQR